VHDCDLHVAVTVVVGTAAVRVDGRGGPTLFLGFSIVALPWLLGLLRMRETVLCPGPDRSRQGSNVMTEPRIAGGSTAAAFDGRISNVIDEPFVLHVRGIDTTTLSPEFP